MMSRFTCNAHTRVLKCTNLYVDSPNNFHRLICLLQHHICKFTIHFCLVAAYCSSSCPDIFSSDVHEWKWSVHVSLQPQNNPPDHSLQQLQHVCLGPEGGQQRQAEVGHAVSSWLMTHHVYSAFFMSSFHILSPMCKNVLNLCLDWSSPTCKQRGAMMTISSLWCGLKSHAYVKKKLSTHFNTFMCNGHMVLTH